MIIVINQADINEGLRNSSTSCPLAQALKRKFHTGGVSVGARTCTISPPGQRPVYGTLCSDAKEFVRQTDTDEPIQACTVNILFGDER